MGCLGLHFSLSAEEVETLRGFDDEADRVDYLHETLEEEYFEKHPDRLAESDKAWDAMHRALSDGHLSWDGGEYPLNHVILGGELLCTESDFIMVLKTPDQVRDVAAVLPGISEADLRSRYFAIDPDEYGMELSEEDCGYTWHWFQHVREFWLRAAQEERFVLFTADQ
ncbi:MAG: YfbM family protein [Planctomycetes bacterium]|nr:YfbM family protein [Planctomycetota bacterium]